MIPFVIAFDLNIYDEPIEDNLYLFAENMEEIQNHILAVIKRDFDNCFDTENCNSFAQFCSLIRREPYNTEDYFTVHYFENDEWKTFSNMSFIDKMWHTIR